MKYQKTEVDAVSCSMYANRYDIGIYYEGSYCFSDMEKLELLKKTWKPDHTFSFPTTTES